MKNRTIKRLSEQFAQSLNGDSFNSSNGVFKVTYKPFSDLSISVGRDPDPSLEVKDSSFQVGDFVIGKVNGFKKKKSGEVIGVTKSKDGKFQNIKIKDPITNKTYRLIPGSIDYTEDRGNTKNGLGSTVTSKERGGSNLKYGGGNAIWGSLENKDLGDKILSQDINTGLIEGPMKTGWKVKFEDQLPAGKTLLNSFVVDPSKNIIHSLRNDRIKELTDKIKAIEAHSYIDNHEDLVNMEKELKSILSILFLEIKNELEAKKNLVKHFHEINDMSYGEAKDIYKEKADELIKKFIE